MTLTPNIKKENKMLAYQLFPDLAQRYTQRQTKMEFPRLGIQANGNNVALVMRGAEEQITGFYNLLYNWGITKGELFRNSDTFAFILTTEERIERGLMAIYFNRLVSNPKVVAHFKGQKGGFFDLLQRLVGARLARIERGVFVNMRELVSEKEIDFAFGIPASYRSSERN